MKKDETPTLCNDEDGATSRSIGKRYWAGLALRLLKATARRDL